MAAPSVNMMARVLEYPIHFGSLGFAINVPDGLKYVPSFDPNQVINFGSLEFVADQLGHLHLHSGGVDSILPVEDTAIVEGGTLAVDQGPCGHVDTYLTTELDPEYYWCMFYVLRNVLSQLFGGESMPPESDF